MDFFPCTNSWRVLGYIFSSLILVMIAIVMSSGSHHKKTHLLSSEPSTLSKNASLALRSSGFTFAASLLQVSPERLLPPSEGTLFAIRDPAITNISLPPWLMKNFLNYHTVPTKLSFSDLLRKPVHSCIPTLHGKNLVITKTNPEERTLEINGVLISHPDIFLRGPYAIHGIVSPFFSPNPDSPAAGEQFIQSPLCNHSSSLVMSMTQNVNRVPWQQIIRILSSNGFISFSIALDGVLDGILQDAMNLSSVTIFVPPDNGFAYVASPSPLLERIVRFHILPQKLSCRELRTMPLNTTLETLVPDQELRRTGGLSFGHAVTIDGVEVIQPNFFSTDEFVIHGISRAFTTMKLAT